MKQQENKKPLRPGSLRQNYIKLYCIPLNHSQNLQEQSSTRPASVRWFSSNWISIKFLKEKPNKWTVPSPFQGPNNVDRTPL